MLCVELTTSKKLFFPLQFACQPLTAVVWFNGPLTPAQRLTSKCSTRSMFNIQYPISTPSMFILYSLNENFSTVKSFVERWKQLKLCDLLLKKVNFDLPFCKLRFMVLPLRISLKPLFLLRWSFIEKDGKVSMELSLMCLWATNQLDILTNKRIYFVIILTVVIGNI